jgi:DNA primase
MENNLLVLGLLESVLGKGKPSKTTADYTFYCPFCKHHKPKLVVNINSGEYNCWTCHPKTKGKTPVSLLKKLSVDKDKIIEMKGYFKGDKTFIDEKTLSKVKLPEEFIPLTNPDKSLEIRHALSYLKNRNVTDQDIYKYNIGFCKKGRYRNKVVVPSYNQSGQINYFIARSINTSSGLKFDSPMCDKNSIIGLEYFVNWSVPIILCEGIFDAIAIRRNAIPLFGKTIPKALMMKLVMPEVKTIYLALDQDALMEALDYAQQLIDLGKEVYLIQLEGKDPSEIGFEKMTLLLQQAKPITFSDLLLKKLSLI